MQSAIRLSSALILAAVAPLAAFAGPAPAAPAMVFLGSSPTLLVAGGARAFLLLEAEASAGDGGAVLHLTFVASPDPAAALADDAPLRAVGTSAELLDAFSAAMPDVATRAEVAAVYGPPGGWGIAMPLRFERAGGAWQGSVAGAAIPARLPPLPGRISRSPAQEEAAVRAARAFLDLADRGDAARAWALVSAAARQATSREALSAQLGPSTPAAGPRRERFRSFEARGGGFTPGDVVRVCLTSGSGADTVHVRLDDDGTWRVLRLERVRRAARLAAAPGRPEPAPRATAPDADTVL